MNIAQKFNKMATDARAGDSENRLNDKAIDLMDTPAFYTAVNQMLRCMKTAAESAAYRLGFMGPTYNTFTEFALPALKNETEAEDSVIINAVTLYFTRLGFVVTSNADYITVSWEDAK